MAKDNPSIMQRQTEYSLRKYKCVMESDDQGNNKYPGTLFVKIEKPFLLLDTYVVDELEDKDKDSLLSQGIDNSLQYLSTHPIINVLTVANCTAFHNSAGKYQVMDLRKDENNESQFIYVLICTNF